MNCSPNGILGDVEGAKQVGETTERQRRWTLLLLPSGSGDPSADSSCVQIFGDDLDSLFFKTNVSFLEEKADDIAVCLVVQV